MLISDSRFDLVWFRLSCDHGWIRSESVNVRKQQQQQQQCQHEVVVKSHLFGRRDRLFEDKVVLRWSRKQIE